MRYVLGKGCDANAKHFEVAHLEAAFARAAQPKKAHLGRRKAQIQLGQAVRAVLCDERVHGIAADKIERIAIVGVELVAAQRALVVVENAAQQADAVQDENRTHIDFEFSAVGVGVHAPARCVGAVDEFVEYLIGARRGRAHRGGRAAAELLDARQDVFLGVGLQRREPPLVGDFERVEDERVALPLQPIAAYFKPFRGRGRSAASHR